MTIEPNIPFGAATGDITPERMAAFNEGVSHLGAAVEACPELTSGVYHLMTALTFSHNSFVRERRKKGDDNPFDTLYTKLHLGASSLGLQSNEHLTDEDDENVKTLKEGFIELGKAVNKFPELSQHMGELLEDFTISHIELTPLIRQTGEDNAYDKLLDIIKSASSTASAAKPRSGTCPFPH